MNELASRLRAQSEGDLTLAVAAVALGIGVAVAYIRVQYTWSDFPLLLLVAVPCALLFALTLAPGADGNSVGTGDDGRIAPWQTASLLVAIPLLAASILLLIKVLGKAHPGTGTATLGPRPHRHLRGRDQHAVRLARGHRPRISGARRRFAHRRQLGG